jgi:hypothetical protein
MIAKGRLQREPREWLVLSIGAGVCGSLIGQSAVSATAGGIISAHLLHLAIMAPLSSRTKAEEETADLSRPWPLAAKTSNA